MTEQEKLVLGFIGNGKSTNRYHLPFILTRQSKIKVKTIYQRTLRDNGWTRLTDVIYTDSLDELLSDLEIDTVVVATPSAVHYEMACKVLSAGKNCIVEKPFANGVEEAAQIFKMAHEKGVMAQCYQNRRFDSDFLTAQKVMASGILGEVYEINMHYDYYRAYVPEQEKSYRRENAFIYTHACHTVDQVLSWLGKPQDCRCDVRQLLGQCH